MKRDYSIALPAAYDWYGNQEEQRKSATLSFSLQNNEQAGLGMPLPAGALRVYEPDANGSVKYVGAASISDTPKDDKVTATLASVFDVYARHKVVSTKKVGKNTLQRNYETVVANEKARDLTVRLVQPMYGKWKIASESHKSAKLNASSNQWYVKVPAGEKRTLKYSVVMKL